MDKSIRLNTVLFSIQPQAESVIRDVGHVSILVNNAGTVRGGHVIDVMEEDFEYSLRVNTLAHIWVGNTGGFTYWFHGCHGCRNFTDITKTRPCNVQIFLKL